MIEEKIKLENKTMSKNIDRRKRVPSAYDRILDYLLKATEPSSKKQITEGTGLSATSIQIYLPHLVAEGKVCEIESRPMLYKIVEVSGE